MSEHDEQVNLIDWAKMREVQIPELRWLFAIPNGTKTKYYKSKTGATYSPQKQKMIAEGLKSGVADLCLPCARGIFHGLYMEMKFGKSKTRPEQDEFLEFVANEGYYSCVCRTFEQARETILEYLSLDGGTFYSEENVNGDL